MTFQVPKSKASIRQNQFPFRVPGEKKDRTLPLMQYLNAETRHRFSQSSALAQAAGDDITPDMVAAAGQLQYDLIEQHHPGLHKLLDGDQIDALVAAWVEASSVTPGESPASADS
jgi:hypothetical protein